MALTATHSKFPQAWGNKAVVFTKLVSDSGTTSGTNITPGLKRIEQVIGACSVTIQSNGQKFDVANVPANTTIYLLVVGEY